MRGRHARPRRLHRRALQGELKLQWWWDGGWRRRDTSKFKLRLAPYRNVGMSYSSRRLGQLAQNGGPMIDPGFALIIAFDYYDGPERGLAVFPSGSAVRFLSLGDSKSRLFRAFDLSPIEGNWWPLARRVVGANDEPAQYRVVAPSKQCGALNRLERDVCLAPSVQQFIGIGSASLEHLRVCRINKSQLAGLRKLGCSNAGFRSAHQIMKLGSCAVE